MNTNFDFNDLFVFDMANNHQGSVEHGRRIVREVAAVARANGVRAALKFQFRELDTFLHPAHLASSSNKHVARFLSTRLRDEEFASLTDDVRQSGLVTMCTPFDEPSVDRIVEIDFDLVKVASSSATDWPLLERIADCNKPVVFSTGGLAWKQIDDLVSFFDHRRVHFAIMHCVSIYPTPPAHLQLNQIELLRRRYPSKVIGFSTHESPGELGAVQVAVAKGARVLERHVGVVADGITLNAYSSTPAQLDAWIKAALHARTMCGEPERPPAPAEEIAALQSLQRGVYARHAIKAGSVLARDDVYFAMPPVEGALQSGEWRPGIVAEHAIGKDQALALASITVPSDPDKQTLFTAIHTIKAMLNEAKVVLNTEFSAEFSHHYGMAQFPEWGATIIECVNRSYCKKLVIQTPGQRHPAHYHKLKEETFQILWGVLELEIEGRRRTLHPGDTALVQQGVWHEFWTDTGVIFEEISTTHVNDDSFYEDKRINKVERSVRKTLVNNWGRYQV